jgi:hypothetical protein
MTQRLMDDVDVTTDQHGTEVRLLQRLVTNGSDA